MKSNCQPELLADTVAVIFLNAKREIIWFNHSFNQMIRQNDENDFHPTLKVHELKEVRIEQNSSTYSDMASCELIMDQYPISRPFFSSSDYCWCEKSILNDSGHVVYSIVFGSTSRRILQRTEEWIGQNNFALFARVVQYFREEKPYLKSGFSIQRLAEDLSTNRSYLSKVINQLGNNSFSGLVNAYRIRHWLDRALKGDARMYSLDTLALECGFANSTTFFRVFKRIHGVSPKNYLQQMSTAEN